MAARKKTARKKTARKKPATGAASASGIVRFKTGFPPGIREQIRRRYGDNWHLSLQIVDGDDGDGDDGDGDDGAATGSSRGTRSSSRAGSRKRASRGSRKSR